MQRRPIKHVRAYGSAPNLNDVPQCGSSIHPCKESGLNLIKMSDRLMTAVIFGYFGLIGYGVIYGIIQLIK